MGVPVHRLGPVELRCAGRDLTLYSLDTKGILNFGNRSENRGHPPGRRPVPQKPRNPRLVAVPWAVQDPGLFGIVRLEPAFGRNG